MIEETRYCDVCGTKDNGQWKWNMMNFFSVWFKKKWYLKSSKPDICHDCYTKVNKFIDTLRKENES